MRKNLVQLAVSILFMFVTSNTVNAQWVKTSGPTGGGYISALAVSGAGDIFAGTHSGGVYLSTNNGTRWTAVNSGLTNINVYSLAISGNNIFAGTDSGGVFLSTNNGTIWNAVDTNVAAVSFAVSGNNIFVGTFGFVYLSTNNGSSWTEVRSGLTNPLINSLAIVGSNIFAGISYGGVCRSSNNGTSWTAISSGLPTGTTVLSFAVSDTNIFAGTPSGVYLSTKNGTHWTAFYQGLPVIKTVYCLAVSSGNIFAGTYSEGVWRRPLSEMTSIINPKLQQGILKQVDFKLNSHDPSDQNISIEFFLTHSDQVIIKIYNLSGNEIVSFVSKYIESGSHTVFWNTRNIVKGCYIARIQAGANTYVKKIQIFR